MPDRITAAGSGVLFDQRRILTTADTVATALSLPADPGSMPTSELLVELPFLAPKKPLRAVVIQWKPAVRNRTMSAGDLDNVAILELQEALPDETFASSVLSNPPSRSHYDTVVAAITEGTLVPFFGAGVNLCGRPEHTPWRRGEYLPSGAELALELANTFRYPWSDTGDLVRVSQYVALIRGLGPLNKRLRYIFDANYPPNELHRFFAHLPGVLRDKGYPPHKLIVTTNYDDVLERAFQEANEPYDLITYVTRGNSEQRGKFLHWTPEGKVNLVEIPNQYHLPTDRNGDLKRSAILKLHGAVDRSSVPENRRDSFVITEDHYIDYLTRADVSSLVPVTLAAKLRSSSFLFLGYSLRDWNLRVILYRIWMEQQQNENYKSWAIQLEPEELESKLWDERDVKIFNSRLEDYIAELKRRVDSLPAAPSEE
jgi:hypothetical protein